MPEYIAPGVYVEEVATGPRPVEGVSTSTTGFVGETERGPTRPTLVTSWAGYQRRFGGFIDRAPFNSPNFYLPYAVRGFFDNGGRRLFIARVTGAVSATAATNPRLDGAPGATAISAIDPGIWGNNVVVGVSRATAAQAAAADSPSQQWFRLQAMYFANGVPNPFIDPFDPAQIANPARRLPDVSENFDNLSPDPTQANFAMTAVNGTSQLIVITACGGRPADVQLGARTLTGGTSVAAADADYLDATQPDAERRRGLAGLSTIREISIVAIPDAFLAAHQSLAASLQDVCDTRRDRFAIHAHTPDTGQVDQVRPLRDSSYGAMYYPLVLVDASHTPEGSVYVPSVGHVAGIYARTDTERGVHKAPANEVVRGIINRDPSGGKEPLSHLLNEREHDILNPRGVNAIRDFRATGRDIRVWGARTMSSDAVWKYVNVRRLLIMIEQSIDRGTQWAVFEPNTEPTWIAMRTRIASFLRTVWRSGALMGRTEAEAFFVRCDRTTLTQDDLDNGRLICLIGVALVKPAEFVIFRNSQKTLESGS